MDIPNGAEIFVDEFGVPHIYGETEEDVVFAQGFYHASQRLFQMEVNRAASNGRLSELFGKDLVEVDTFMRTFGFRRLAKKHKDVLGDGIKIVQAYVDGINAYLDTNPAPPVEFTLLGLNMTKWSVLDVDTLARMISMRMSRGWAFEIINSRLQDLEKKFEGITNEIKIKVQNNTLLILVS